MIKIVYKKSNIVKCITAITAISSFALTACSDNKHSTISIGTVMPITSDDKTNQINTKDLVEGIRLAVQDANKNGGINGKQIELIETNNQDKKSTSMDLITKLSKDSKVCAIIGPVYEDNAKETLPVFKKEQVVGMLPNKLTSNIADENSYVFQTILPNKKVAPMVLAKVASMQPDSKNIAFVYAKKDDNAEDIYKSFEKSASDNGLNKVLEQSFNVDNEDFSGIVESLKNANAQLLVYGGPYEEAIKLITALDKQGVNLTIISDSELTNPALLSAVGELSKNIIAYTNFYGDEANAFNKKLADIAQEGKVELTPSVASAYESASVIIASMRNAGISDCSSSSRDKIKDDLSSGKKFDGIDGAISFDKDGMTQKAPLMLKVTSGEHNTLRYEPIQ